MGALEFLKQTNQFLEQIPGTIPTYFNAIFKSGESMSQKAVDMVCEWAAWKVNLAVERKRQALIKTLYDQNSVVNKVLAPVQAFVSMVTNPLAALGALASAVTSILNIFIAPFAALINFVIDLVTELAKLAENLANIAAMTPPDPPNPHINYDAFQVKVGDLSLGTIMGGPDGMPTPEEMFPEPPKPFVSKEFWKALQEGGNSTYKKERPVFKLPKKSSKEETSEQANQTSPNS